MPVRISRPLVGGLVLVGSVAFSPVGAAPYLGAEAAVSQGDFGTDNTARLSTVNVSGGVVEQRYDAGVVMPVLHLSDDEDLSESGLGDVLVRGGRGVLRSADWTADVALSVKLPTADDAKSLGTGELDLGAFLDVGRQWDNAKTSIGLGYIMIGDPTGIDYDNVFTWYVSVFGRIDRLGLNAALRGQTSMFADGDDPLDLSLSGFYALSPGYAATFSAFIGLSDGAPDGGASAGFVRWF